MNCSNLPNSLIVDFAVGVRKHVSLRDDRSPRNLRVLGAELLRNAARCLPNDLDASFDGQSQILLIAIMLLRLAANLGDDGSAVLKHVPEMRGIIALSQHGSPRSY